MRLALPGGEMRQLSPSLRMLGLAAVSLAALLAAGPARAGCGCEKPPPPPAAVRPAVTWPGRDVTFFHEALEAGRSYRVRFVSALGGGSREVTATAVSRRDLADGAVRPQLVVPLPDLPLGPARIEVRAAAGPLTLDVPDHAFTVAPPPIPILTHVDRTVFEDVRGAVGRDGVVYLSLDFSEIQHARVFRAQALGYPLRFTHDDVVFWNVQGFLMQLLGEDMPGLYTVSTGSLLDSDVLQYSRHEFHTHLLAHVERGGHALDPEDPNWHLDGTRHIDHDHQIIAIDGHLLSLLPPAAGATPPFDLVLETHTLFQHGLLGDDSVEVSGEAAVDSYDSATALPGANGDVRSNGPVFVDTNASVAGDVAAESAAILGSVTGSVSEGVAPLELLPVDVPSAAQDLGSLEVGNDDTVVLSPGSYRVDELIVGSDGQLVVDNAAGPVTLYVTEKVDVQSTLGVQTAAADPERFAVYVAAGADVKISNEAVFHGVVYAPGADVEVSGQGEWYGAFVGRNVKVTGGALVHYDEALQAEYERSSVELPVLAELRLPKARHARRSGKVKVAVRSSEGASVPLLVSIEGVATDLPMKWKQRSRRWVFKGEFDVDLAGREVTMRGTDGSLVSLLLK
jgi:hypothetical protein